MHIDRHPTWTALYGEITLEGFIDRFVPKIIFKQDVHTDIKKAFGIIEKLLIHSYFEYEFLDIAYTKALQTFEMALKLRYKEITSVDWEKRKRLVELIKWFENGKYFEVDNPAYMNHVRNARNHFSHPWGYGFGGYAGMHWIDTTVDLINDLYENVELRLERRKKRKELLAQFQNILNPGARLTMHNLNEMIYNVNVVFIDNKIQPNNICVSFLPLFKDENDPIQPRIINIPEDIYSMTETEFSFFPQTNIGFKFTSLSDDYSITYFKGWIQSWQRTDNSEDLSKRGAMHAKHTMLLHSIDEVFKKLRREFHHR